jgi:probable rRNA maturation factor
MTRVHIANRQKAAPVDRALMRRAARAVLAGEGVADAEISLVFVDDAESARVNETFLQHDGPTDVITFPLEDEPLQGELIVGVPVAAREAAARGHEISAELALYVIHGVLHLCGYDDKKAGPRKRMRAREALYLHQLGLPAIAERT